MNVTTKFCGWAYLSDQHPTLYRGHAAARLWVASVPVDIGLEFPE